MGGGLSREFFSCRFIGEQGWDWFLFEEIGSQEQTPGQLEGKDVLGFDSISSYAGDSPIALLERSYGLVLGPLLEDLPRIYFQNIHPYYPVIDEFDFDVSASEAIDDEVLRQSRAMVLCAMFLCASMVPFSQSLRLEAYMLILRMIVPKHKSPLHHHSFHPNIPPTNNLLHL